MKRESWSLSGGSAELCIAASRPVSEETKEEERRLR